MPPAISPRTALIMAAGLLVLSALTMLVVSAERRAIERTLAEIRNLPEG